MTERMNGNLPVVKVCVDGSVDTIQTPAPSAVEAELPSSSGEVDATKEQGKLRDKWRPILGRSALSATRLEQEAGGVDEASDAPEAPTSELTALQRIMKGSGAADESPTLPPATDASEGEESPEKKQGRQLAERAYRALAKSALILNGSFIVLTGVHYTGTSLFLGRAPGPIEYIGGISSVANDLFNDDSPKYKVGGSDE